jgi:hypothetical protein
VTAACAYRVSVWDDERGSEADLLWLGFACVKCRKPLGRDGVVLWCEAHEDSLGPRHGFHSIHKTCLDGKPLENVTIEGRAPVLLREVLQLALFSLSEGSDGTKDPSTH